MSSGSPITTSFSILSTEVSVTMRLNQTVLILPSKAFEMSLSSIVKICSLSVLNESGPTYIFKLGGINVSS